MEMGLAIAAIITMSALAVFFGIGLAVAAKIFHVDVDPKVEPLTEALPGVNCGACGYPGCAAYAEAIASGEAEVGLCPVCSPEQNVEVAAIMGVEMAERVRDVAVVRCKGGRDVGEIHKYDGPVDCRAAVLLTRGVLKNCEFACLGMGTCGDVCPFGAIVMRGGTPYINEDRCTACGKCVAACPKDIIELRPVDKTAHVQCMSHQAGKVVNKLCKVGCIACKKCEKSCKKDAIHVVDNLAEIDYDKCVNCGLCAKVCPKDVIGNFRKARKAGLAIPQANAEYSRKDEATPPKDKESDAREPAAAT